MKPESDINPAIINKIKNSDETESMKNFLYEILELEYDHIDESKPRLKNDYIKLINTYKD
ncbi:hypothetical protein [Methanobrevibacter boviskoreani]|uniref:hypothetical protein n=1 Tax=Methanobrevibacter boviskoreani TaxID=1348249 RepID=UPI0023A7F282|nr:hypothetical protein [Methanobrevibacter boviskoreani]MCI6775405.1 hypothetical protein [Methanobrevibacter boviskoreani]MDY5613840.1 hypothetical protein [Methanobrevibacter boviskoreani]